MLRVSSPLKLRNTSYFCQAVEEEKELGKDEESVSMPIKAIRKYRSDMQDLKKQKRSIRISLEPKKE